MPKPDPLTRLQQLQELGQKQDLGDSAQTGDLVKMLGELYGLHEKQQMDPALLAKTQAETGLAQAHGELYKERPEELHARAMQAELTGLDRAYQYDSNNPEYHQGRRNILSKYGYNMEAPQQAQPHDAFTGGDGTTPPPHSPGIFQKMTNSAFGSGAPSWWPLGNYKAGPQQQGTGSKWLPAYLQ